MPALDWNHDSDAYKRLRPYLGGDFTCGACDAKAQVWHPICPSCSRGLLQPLPLIPTLETFVFDAQEFFTAVWQKPIWAPEELQAHNIEAVVEGFRGPHLFFRQRSELRPELQPVNVEHMYFGTDEEGSLIEAETRSWGHIPFVGFTWEKLGRQYRKNAQITIALMVPTPIIPV